MGASRLTPSGCALEGGFLVSAGCGESYGGLGHSQEAKQRSQQRQVCSAIALQSGDRARTVPGGEDKTIPNIGVWRTDFRAYNSSYRLIQRQLKTQTSLRILSLFYTHTHTHTHTHRRVFFCCKRAKTSGKSQSPKVTYSRIQLYSIWKWQNCRNREQISEH
jgi:hypothetical protein